MEKFFNKLIPSLLLIPICIFLLLAIAYTLGEGGKPKYYGVKCTFCYGGPFRFNRFEVSIFNSSLSSKMLTVKKGDRIYFINREKIAYRIFPRHAENFVVNPGQTKVFYTTLLTEQVGNKIELVKEEDVQRHRNLGDPKPKVLDAIIVNVE